MSKPLLFPSPRLGWDLYHDAKHTHTHKDGVVCFANKSKVSSVYKKGSTVYIFQARESATLANISFSHWARMGPQHDELYITEKTRSRMLKLAESALMKLGAGGVEIKKQLENRGKCGILHLDWWAIFGPLPWKSLGDNLAVIKCGKTLSLRRACARVSA